MSGGGAAVLRGRNQDMVVALEQEGTKAAGSEGAFNMEELQEELQ